jgi:Tol biopolymer transport system component/DNA-binding winged helix-turn-helix (wHTH) protein
VFGPFVFDCSEHRLSRDGHPLHLTPKVHELLCLLVERSGHLVEKDELIKALWPDTIVEEGGLTRCVSVLRRALGDDAADTRYIETVPKRGYRFVASVTRRDAATFAPLEPPASSILPPAGHVARRAVGRFAAVGVALAIIGALLIAYALRRSTPRPATVVSSDATFRQLTFGGKQGTPSLSPDGRAIAYVSMESAERRLVVQNVDGGPDVTVFSAPEVGGARWSPDGSELLFWARGGQADGTYIVPRAGGSASRISEAVAVAAWSPDGATIALARPLVGQIVFKARRDAATRSIALQNVKRWIADLDWSARGLLVVANDNDGRHTIWVVQPDGSDQRLVLEDRAEITAARWSPGGEAAYYFRKLHQTTSLYRVPIAAGAATTDAAPTPLLAGLETDGWLSFSADAARLVFARAPYSSNLAVMEVASAADGVNHEPRWLTEGTAVVERPRVSPDGKTVVFNSGPPGSSNLFTVPLAGGPAKQLTFLDGLNIGGVWSPDGQWIAFASTHGGLRRVWRVRASGGPARPISSGALSDTFELAWSPGREILYQQSGNRNFFAIDPATNRERPLLSDASRGWLFSPVYSPDASRIAVAWSRRPDVGHWLIEPSGAPVALVAAGSMESPIAWSSDGKAFYIADGKRSAYRGVTVDTGETSTEAHLLRIGLDGTRQMVLRLPFEEVGGVTVTPDGGHVVCAVYRSRSDVWLVDRFDRTPASSR